MSTEPTPPTAPPADATSRDGEDSGVAPSVPMAIPSPVGSHASVQSAATRPSKTIYSNLGQSVVSLASSEEGGHNGDSDDAAAARRRVSLDVEPPIQPSSPLTPGSFRSMAPWNSSPRPARAESSKSALEQARAAVPGRPVPSPRRQVFLNEEDEDPLLRSFDAGGGLAIGGLRAVQPAMDSPALQSGSMEGILQQAVPEEEEEEEEQPHPPIFTRTMSAPLPARVGRLRNPHTILKPGVGVVPPPLPPSRSSNGSASSGRSAPGPAASADMGHHRASSSDLQEASKSRALQTLSHELADSLQSAIQTLLHLAPPHLLDNAKEQYSGCTVQMPTTSLSALLTAMKGLNYLSANFRALCDDEATTNQNRVADATPRAGDGSLPPVSDGSNEQASPISSGPTPSASTGFGLAPLAFGAPGLLDDALRLSGDDFDIGELLQSTADLLSGQAALAGVELVLFHGDVGIKHVSVKGDGEGLAYALGVVLRQILAICKPGDCLELGLQVSPQSPSQTPKVNFPSSAVDLQQGHRPMTRPSGVSEEETAGTVSPGETMRSQSVINGGPLLCTFEIVHNMRTPTLNGSTSSANTPRPDDLSSTEGTTPNPETFQRRQPDFGGPLCRRIIRHVNASLREGVLNESPPLPTASPSSLPQPRRTYEVSVLLRPGEPIAEPTVLTAEEQAARQPFPSLRLAREPTLSELSDFTETLRGKRVELHAGLQSVFARHLTNYLAAWGMDISHIPIEEDEETEQAQKAAQPKTGLAPRYDSGYGGSIGGRSPLRTPNSESERGATTDDPGANQDRLIIIDDDVSVLKRQLLKMRAESPILSLRPRNLKRPSLTTRAKSSPQVRSLQSGLNGNKSPTMAKKPAGVVIHFTSISNYNHVRDVVAGILAISPESTFQQPEVMVIPKPVGPRRFLTALHTALDRPLVDPFFSPIATSPRSPGGGYFSNAPSRAPSTTEGVTISQLGGVPEETSDEANSDDPLVAGMKGLSVQPAFAGNASRYPDPTHLQIATPSGEIVATSALEYFSEAVAKLGGSAAAGLMVQSPDGRPFGMYFDPPQRSEGRRASYSQVPPSQPRRRSVGKTPNFDPPQPGSPAQIGSPSTRRQSTMSQTSGGVADSRRNSSYREDPDEEEEDAEHDRRNSTKSSKSQDSPVGAAAAARRRVPTTPVMPPSAFQPKSRDRSSTITSNDRPIATPRATSPVAMERTASKSLPPTPGDPETEAAVASPRAGSARSGGKKAAAIQARAAARAQIAETAAAAAALAAKPPIAVKKSQAKEGVVVPPINVLIVEDNPINQNILSMFLRKKKIKHQAAKDGQEAVEKWRTGVFHLILMDIQLPVMDGIEATKEIRRLERSSNIGVFPSTPSGEQPPSPIRSDLPPTTPLRSSVIIVALTASSLQTDRVNALAAGCNDFLTKPVSLKWLETKIVEWGCMQALIDFEGWRRWKSADGKPNLEIKRAFQAGPDAKAKSVASRLRIDRTNKAASRSSSPSQAGSKAAEATPSAQPDTPAVPGSNVPDIKVQQATPAPSGNPEETPSSAREEGPGHTSLPNESLQNVMGENQSGADALHQGLVDAQKDQASAQSRSQSQAEGRSSDSSSTPGTESTPRPKSMPRMTSLASVESGDVETPLAESAFMSAPSPHEVIASIAKDPETAQAPELDPVTAPHLHHELPGRILLDPESIEAGGADDGPEPKSEPSSNESGEVPPIGSVPRIRKPSAITSEKDLPPLPPS